MKIGFKKLLISLGLGAMLTFGATAAVSAATGAELKQFSEPEEVTEFMLEDNEENAQAGAYLDHPSDAVQTAATLDSISLKWNAVTNATGYKIYIGAFNATASSDYKYLGVAKSTSCKIQKLLPGTAYKVRILAQNSSETAKYYVSLGCTTLYKGAKIRKISNNSSGTFTFLMQTPSPVNAITGYHVTYTNYATGKSFSRYYNSRYSFQVTPKENTFYRLVIKPYITLNGKKFVSPSGTVKYIARQPKLSKLGYTSNSMTIGWKKVAGATSYSIYVKYPGSSSYKKVKTTGALSYKLTGMKQNQDYLVKVIANRRTAHSASSTYYRMRLYRY